MSATFVPEPLTYFVGNANGRGLIRIETDATAKVAGVHIASLTRDVLAARSLCDRVEGQ